jgi:pimeloyl-ACP methyl ester carboxylesterase
MDWTFGSWLDATGFHWKPTLLRRSFVSVRRCGSMGRVVFQTVRVSFGLLFSIVLLIPAASAWQDREGANKAGDKKEKLPKPERVLFETKDNVELKAEWFGALKSKQTAPVILLHDWDSSRAALLPLADQLHSKHKLAVLVPDLRGHGESLTVVGSDEPLDRARFKKTELGSLVEDIDACRRFLQEKNDLGELNLSMLTLVAFGNTSIHASAWAINDWKWPPLHGIPQGQNVKALVLISPSRRFKSLNINPSMKLPLFASPYSALQVFLVWGKNDKTSATDGSQLFNQLAKSRNQKDDFQNWDERWRDQTVFEWTYDSDRAAEELLNQFTADVAQAIGVFVQKKIVDKQENFPWKKRR